MNFTIFLSLSSNDTALLAIHTLSLTISFLPISQAKYFGIFPTNIFHNCSNYRLCIEIYYYYDYFYIPELNCLRANMAGKLTKKPNLIPSSQTLSNFGNWVQEERKRDRGKEKWVRDSEKSYRNGMLSNFEFAISLCNLRVSYGKKVPLH